MSPGGPPGGTGREGLPGGTGRGRAVWRHRPRKGRRQNGPGKEVDQEPSPGTFAGLAAAGAADGGAAAPAPTRVSASEG
jgi:hypothetical protein